jgi:hypothetical protein
MSDFTNFRAVYDELTDEVARAAYAFMPGHLRNWFDHLDGTPQVSAVISRLQEGLDVDGWLHQAMDIKKLTWGGDREKALGMKLLLFRTFAYEKMDIGLFGFNMLRVSRNPDENARVVIEQMFSPMARELRRALEGELGRPQSEKVPIPVPLSVPASDRSVPIDHNSQAYADADAAMEKLETAIREANDFPDPAEKEQREAEVSAARRLLWARIVRLEPLVALLRPILVEYVSKVKDGLVAHAASATVNALTELFATLGALFKSMLGL